MQASATQLLTILIIVAAFAIFVIATQFARRRRAAFPLRALPAFDVLPTMVGASIEAGRPVHVSFGSAGVGGLTTPLTLASAELAYQVAQRAAAGAIPPILTVSETSALPLAYGTLRRAYAARNRLEGARWGAGVRWYAGGTRSLAFAAALTGVLGDDRPTSSAFVGSFGAELALPLEAATRRAQMTIAGSDQLEGAAVAYVMADHALLGEETFMAGAYLSEQASFLGGAVAQDVLRVLLILGLLVPAVVVVGDVLSDGAILRALTALLGGR